ncbi:UNVERIFIED_CONTAM: hypothetical protein HDU68_003485 [Siphonaria sp. JEL0065]|nr:hypothetical protein HDU68_003485 [Siphonaria sp. JEL0065]
MVKKKAAKKGAKASSSTPITSANTNESLAIASARAALDACNPILARQTLLPLTATSTNADVFELLGVIEMEEAAALHSEAFDASQGDSIQRRIEQHSTCAEQFFRKAVELNPERVAPSTFLYLGQLSADQEALTFYKHGITGLDDEKQTLLDMDTPEDDPAITDLNAKIAAALCSMTEIYMTDCCDDPLAEHNCTTFTQQAIQLDPTSPEAYQTLASVLLSKCNPPDATTAILTSLSLWSFTDANTWPTYPTRLATAKILMEVDKDDEAASVLETVLKENDEDLEVWYLFSWCYYRMGGGSNCVDGGMDLEEDGGSKRMVETEEKVEAFLDAKECLERLLEV